MKVKRFSSNFYQVQSEPAFQVPQKSKSTFGSVVRHRIVDNPSETNSIAFRGGTGSLSKRFLFFFKELSNYMKEPSEMTNAQIAAFGTGVIAPFAIIVSPKKKTTNENDKKTEKEKKFFQALRQPVSAFLAFAFQVPTTILIAKILNFLAYVKNLKFFDDEILHHLIPDKKYLKSQAKKVLRKNADEALKKDWENELKIVADEAKIKKEIIEQRRRKYNDVKLTVSESKLSKEADNKKRKINYMAEKMANAKHDSLIDEKVKELLSNKYDIKDSDLVTDEYQKLAKNNYKEDFQKLRKEHNLSFFDKFIKSIGISNKRISKLADAEKKLAQEKGLILLRKNEPNIFKDEVAKLKKFIENKDAKAQKLYKNKIFWLTLLTNLFMVAISCVALNWLHPKFADFVDNIKQKHQQKNNNPKTEVRA